MSTIIRFKTLYPDAVPPMRAVSGDAGWDLSAHSLKKLDMNGTVMFLTGIAVEMPPGYFGLLRPRSSICKSGMVFNSSGVIDSGYRGEIGVPMRIIATPELSSSYYEKGSRIAQLIILPLPDVSFVQVDSLSDSERGAGGFGSTGK